MKRLLLPLLLVLALAACDRGADDTLPADTIPATDAPAAAPAPATPEPAVPADAPATETAPADAATPDPVPAETAPADPATADGATPAADAPAAALPAPPAFDPATSPRRDVDFTVLATPQPLYGTGPGIEVAEVFGYSCIHCANLQPSMTAWKATLPSDVRVEYVPAVFGGPWDNYARAFYAAEATGILEKTHDALFEAVFVQQAIPTGTVEEIADWYATKGANRDTFLSTMQSFAVTGKLNRAKQFAMRAGVNSTPTLIVNGKYLATMTRTGGPDGLLKTVDYLVAHERAGSTPP